ncbi:hypothetical protein ACQ63I_001361 [Enterococcus faecalis]|uniref:hypothetical protein n=1 Tax=Enterococcus faecalis TaxID=1351 RepID=UPI0001F0C747|nr:hypothetical protein [Enterococcus faecalis]EFT95183.1 hypothetical protein HMPREF9499_00626 [Enterococcus faecalis TX0012]EHU8539399.1 hypothetical protein [Enterococcus faecalis]EIQ7148360.1 hypothetical protein [Enterococcus faecalis]
MELEELSESLDISIKTLARLKREKLFDFDSLSTFSDEHKKQLVTILSLEKIGLSATDIKMYLDLSRNQQTNDERLVRLLRKYRSSTLDSMHQEQEKLYSIDFMIYELQHSERIL